MRAAGRDDQPENYKLKYLYDGGCSVCNALVKLLKSKRGHEKIWCVRPLYPRADATLAFAAVARGVPRAYLRPACTWSTQKLSVTHNDASFSSPISGVAPSRSPPRRG